MFDPENLKKVIKDIGNMKTGLSSQLTEIKKILPDKERGILSYLEGDLTNAIKSGNLMNIEKVRSMIQERQKQYKNGQ